MYNTNIASGVQKIKNQSQLLIFAIPRTVRIKTKESKKGECIMKKVNLFNKKVMSVGLAASLLATSLGSTACFAENVDAGTQTEYRDMETKTDDNIFEAKKPIVAAGTEETAENVKNEEKEIKEENFNVEEKEIKEEPKVEKKSKKEIAKTVAKVVAAAAIAGTVAYLGYRYRAPIAENLTAAGKYIADSAKSAATSVATGTKNLAGRAVNATKSAGSYIASKAASAVNSIKSFGSKNKDSQEKIVQILTYNSNTTEGNITNSTETTGGYCHNPWFKNDFKASTTSAPKFEKSTALVEYNPSVNTSKCTDIVEWKPSVNTSTSVPETNIANTTSLIESSVFENNFKASTPSVHQFEKATEIAVWKPHALMEWTGEQEKINACEKESFLTDLNVSASSWLDKRAKNIEIFKNKAIEEAPKVINSWTNVVKTYNDARENEKKSSLAKNNLTITNSLKNEMAGCDFSNRIPLLIDNSEVIKSETTEPGKIAKIAGKASDFWINTKKELKVKSEEPCVMKELMKIIKGSYANYVKPLISSFYKNWEEGQAKTRKRREILERARREQNRWIL